MCVWRAGLSLKAVIDAAKFEKHKLRLENGLLRVGESEKATSGFECVSTLHRCRVETSCLSVCSHFRTSASLRRLPDCLRSGMASQKALVSLVRDEFETSRRFVV